jgi:hypothetical protein
MGVILDYFAAPSDEAARTAIDEGPAAAPHSFPTVALAGVDPAVSLGKLEELLTGVDYDSLADGPRAAQAVEVRNDGELVVVTLTDELQAALAVTDEARLREVAAQWALTEEFTWGGDEPPDLTDALAELAALARTATVRGDRLYCWICV